MIVKAGLLLFRQRGGKKELMFVKPYGKDLWVFPGGKRELGETVEAALARELQEELAVGVGDVIKLGVVRGATPDGRAMTMHLYSGVLRGDPQPSAEIEHILWLDETSALHRQAEMTPMTLDRVFPFIKQRKLW